MSYRYYMESPTFKQINLVEKMCQILRIKDFPTSSLEYTKKEYSRFIKNNMEEYIYALNEMNTFDEDLLYMFCDNDIYTEYF